MTDQKTDPIEVPKAKGKAAAKPVAPAETPVAASAKPKAAADGKFVKTDKHRLPRREKKAKQKAANRLSA